MIRKRWWSMGITLRWHGDGWSGRLTFHGYVTGENAVEGELRTSAIMKGLCDGAAVARVVDTLRREAGKTGIHLGFGDRKPSLYAHRDGEASDEPMPEGWKILLRTEAARIGWDFPHLSDHG